MEKADKERYAAEKVKFDKYLKSHPDKAPVSSKKAAAAAPKKKGATGGPKRSTSAFFFFQADR